jgi:membrane-associated phospholipid phosphatase
MLGDVSRRRSLLRPWGFSRDGALWAAVWLALLAASIVLSVLAALYSRLPGDLAISEWVQGSLFPGMGVSELVRLLGDTQVVLVTGAVAVVALWLRGRRREAVLLALGLIALPLLQTGVKQIVDRPRPTEDLIELRAGYTSPSFPSGHVMSGTLLYGFLLYLVLRGRRWLPLRAMAGGWCLFAIVLAGPANVYVGVHWASDTLGGYLWASVLLVPLFYANVALGAPPTGGSASPEDP